MVQILHITLKMKHHTNPMGSCISACVEFSEVLWGQKKIQSAY